MKKFFFLAAATLMSFSAMATDIWTGSKHVSWGDGGLQIPAASFASAKAGDKIVVTYSAATDGMEFKVMNPGRFDHLAGSREALWINGAGTMQQFLTQTAVDSLKLYGLEIIGANFTATKVELNDGKADLKDGYTVWTGYFWADNLDCRTLELYKDCYLNADFSKATAIRFYSEAKDSYALNFLKGWGGDEKFADEKDMTAGDGYLELTLTDALRTAMKEAGHWMIQYCGVQNSFNVTDVVLVMNNTPSDIHQAVKTSTSVKYIQNGQLIIVRDGARYNALGVQF